MFLERKAHYIEGATFTLPILMDLVNKIVNSDLDCKLIYILAVRHTDTLAWMSRDLVIAANASVERGIKLEIHVTGDNAQAIKDVQESVDIENKLDSRELPLPRDHIKAGRPYCPAIIRDICADSANGRIGIAGENFVCDNEHPSCTDS